MGPTVHRPLPQRDPSQIPVSVLGLAILNTLGRHIRTTKGLAILKPHT
jgi:hypothetical protein